MINGINNLGTYGFNPYSASFGAGVIGDAGNAFGIAGTGPVGGIGGSPNADEAGKTGRVSPSDCQTCANRTYQDGSDENVSFKSPTKISPEAAAGAVRAHEQEHVSNAYKKAAMNNGEVISANVTIHMAVCSECGRSYVSGGTTTTKIRYSDEANPYQKNKKQNDAAGVIGMNFDEAV
ncbi:MAG: hypothetical protein FWG91_10965 [Lachnospiraceae bacterium]|nr:hypothetical protein [Lachnospiraceae bacterium]